MLIPLVKSTLNEEGQNRVIQRGGITCLINSKSFGVTTLPLASTA